MKLNNEDIATVLNLIETSRIETGYLSKQEEALKAMCIEWRMKHPHVSQHEGPQNPEIRKAHDELVLALKDDQQRTRKEYFLVTCYNLNTFTSACECAIKEGGVPIGGVAMALVPPKIGETQDAFKYAQAFIREVPRETKREE